MPLLLLAAAERELEPRGEEWRKRTRRAVAKRYQEGVRLRITEETLDALQRYLDKHDIRATTIAEQLGISRAAVSQWWSSKKISRGSLDGLESLHPGIFAAVRAPNETTRKERAVAGFGASMLLIRRDVLNEGSTGPPTRAEFAWLEHCLASEGWTETGGLLAVAPASAQRAAVELRTLGLSTPVGWGSAHELRRLEQAWLRPYVHAALFLSEIPGQPPGAAFGSGK